MLIVATLNYHNYLGRGDEYVQKLKASVDRHLHGQQKKFVTITEEDGIEGATGWWAKIHLFKNGLFPSGSRVLFFDLDTIITGDLSGLAAYKGRFCGLSDFNNPGRFASGVMSWEAGTMSHIYDRWAQCGKPDFDPGGDQNWIASCEPHADRWQKMPETWDHVQSFKVNCLMGIPENARVICFHGLPRPHHVSEIMQHWAV